MPKGVYKRKAKRRGRPKGSRNKKTALGQRLIKAATEAVRHAQGEDVGAKETHWRIVLPTDATPTEPPTFLSRLEAATVKYEQAIKEAIKALKGN